MNRQIMLTACVALAIFSCKPKKETSTGSASAETKAAETTTTAPKEYTYETAANDPLGARIYTLDNGLKVYMSVYKDEPRIQTMIAVKAGSKNDPADATGLAHYLEHMLFKGTDKYGTQDFAQENVLIEKVKDLYEVYRQTTDEAKRKELYKQIDSLSGLASNHAIANEYDKMVTAFGAKGTNAYTSFDQTVYINDIPSNQLENFLTLESERFRKPILRLFHTELEAVYEEKNRGLDNDMRKLYFGTLKELFKNHQYGTQTTIGTIDHLKNPSMKKIEEYYYKHYVPNNMAIVLSGDFDPDKTIRMIDESFGKFESKEVPSFTVAKEDPITAPVKKEVWGPQAEMMMIGYRMPGAGHPDATTFKMVDMILNNSAAGLIDLNIMQKQKMLRASSSPFILKDYSAHLLYGMPKQGQSLEEVKELLLEQVELLRKGEFPDWLMSAIVNDLKLSQIKGYERNYSRCDAMLDAFVNDMSWEFSVNEIAKMEKLTKQDVIDFVNKYYTKDNYAYVFKRSGEDKSIQKVVKPEITPVSVNRDSQSPFLKKLVNNTPAAIEPVFVNYEQDITKGSIKNDIPVYMVKNEENELFNLYYVLDMGKDHNKKLALAISYLEYMGTADKTPEQVKQDFYRLGCNFGVYSARDEVYVSLSGISSNFDKALTLFEQLLTNPSANPEALENLKADILKSRQDSKKDKGTILNKALFSYGVYGKHNPFKDNLISEKDLKAVKSPELIEIIKDLNKTEHRVLYYGPMDIAKLQEKLNAMHIVPRGLKPVPAPTKYTRQETKGKVYVVEYDMQQAEIVMLSKGPNYSKELGPIVSMYNNYFGAGMSSIVFQEIREARALAYSAYSYYQSPDTKIDPYYNFTYVGTQADKLPEAMEAMTGLLNEIPEAEQNFQQARQTIDQKIRTSRTTKTGILFDRENSAKLGLTDDPDRATFEKVQRFEFDDVRTFHQSHIANKDMIVLVIGKKEKLDIEALKKYGTVEFLTLEDIFGY